MIDNHIPLDDHYSPDISIDHIPKVIYIYLFEK